MRKGWRLWLGLVISAAALVLVLVGIDLRQVVETLAAARYSYLIPAAATMLAYLFARAVRWRLLLPPGISLARCFWVTNIGYLVSNILPLRLGDPARAVVLGRDAAISAAAVLSTVVVERVLDMLMVVMMLAGVAPFVTGAESALGIGWVAGAGALSVMAVLVMLAFRPDWGRRLLQWGLSLIPRIDRDRWARTLDGLFEGLAPLRSGRRGLALLLWSIVAWACVVGHYWSMLWAFLEQPPFVAGVFLTCAVGLGMAVPSAPGAMGVFHAFAEGALVIPFGVPESQAVTIAFAAHAFQYGMMCLLGLVGLARESLSLRWVRSRVTGGVEG